MVTPKYHDVMTLTGLVLVVLIFGLIYFGTFKEEDQAIIMSKYDDKARWEIELMRLIGDICSNKTDGMEAKMKLKLLLPYLENLVSIPDYRWHLIHLNYQTLAQLETLTSDQLTILWSELGEMSNSNNADKLELTRSLTHRISNLTDLEREIKMRTQLAKSQSIRV